ncbi:hypothetical protein LCGC14_2910960 [marine sediment metagenome]|uniref:Uncharacterized protein n=1 Tax=marine sediment metagenome TaxID=412755 RepID=A0A0F9AHS8_9ZZZZ
MKHDRYPIEYRQMFQKAIKVPVIMLFSTHAKAVAFRVELYKYRYAVRDALPKSQTLYDTVMSIKMSIKGEVLKLQIKKADFVEKLSEH